MSTLRAHLQHLCAVQRDRLPAGFKCTATNAVLQAALDELVVTYRTTHPPPVERGPTLGGELLHGDMFRFLILPNLHLVLLRRLMSLNKELHSLQYNEFLWQRFVELQLSPYHGPTVITQISIGRPWRSYVLMFAHRRATRVLYREMHGIPAQLFRSFEPIDDLQTQGDYTHILASNRQVQRLIYLDTARTRASPFQEPPLATDVTRFSSYGKTQLIYLHPTNSWIYENTVVAALDGKAALLVQKDGEMRFVPPAGPWPLGAHVTVPRNLGQGPILKAVLYTLYHHYYVIALDVRGSVYRYRFRCTNLIIYDKESAPMVRTEPRFVDLVIGAEINLEAELSHYRSCTLLLLTVGGGVYSMDDSYIDTLDTRRGVLSKFPTGVRILSISATANLIALLREDGLVGTMDTGDNKWEVVTLPGPVLGVRCGAKSGIYYLLERERPTDLVPRETGNSMIDALKKYINDLPYQ